VSYVPCNSVMDEQFHYECPWSVAEAEVRGAQPLDINSKLRKSVARGFKRYQIAKRGHILHIRTPNYSFILPKVDCWRRDQEFGGESSEVSGAVSCSLVQI
jgi:hypothetical protein